MLKSASRSILSKLGYQLTRIEKSPLRWPHKSTDSVDAPTILIFTPPNSGSTAISKFLTSSDHVASFNPVNNEMQWIVPGLIEQDRWWPQKPVCYQSVAGCLQKAVDEARAQEPKVQYFVEKSPPNMVRHAKVVALFNNPKILVNNRDPYANISSQLSRYSNTHYRDLLREDIVSHLTEMWVVRSQYLAEIADVYDAPILTYEGFCQTPSQLLTDLALTDVPDLDPKGEVKVKVKDYEAQGISNMNERQISQLKDVDIAQISALLKPHEALLARFDYALL